MAGELVLYDSSRYNPIAADYLNGIPAGDVSDAGIVWVKNVGSSQVSGITATIQAVNSGDGVSMLRMCSGVPIASPIVAPAHALGAGNIVGPTDLYYKIAALGVADGPSLPSPAVAVSAPNNSSVQLSWAAVANALGYAIYISANNVDFYLKDRVYAELTYVDLDGIVNTSAERAVTLNQAFREGTYSALPLAIGALDPDDMFPLIYRAEIPLGTTPNANTRLVDIEVEGVSL